MALEALLVAALLLAQDLGGGFGAGGAAGARRAPDLETRLVGPMAILIYGGENNRTFLGCLNCAMTAPESVDNSVGRFGSPVSPTSIRNAISYFGSAVSSFSACNVLAQHPPVIVDTKGTYFGELTRNTVRPARATAPSVVAWLAGVCADR